MFPLSPTSLGTFTTFHLTSSLTCLAMKIGGILVMRTFSSPLPLLVPGTLSSLLSQFGVLRTPLTLLQTTPSPSAIPLMRHSRSAVPLSPLLTGILQSPLVALFGNATILTLLTLRFSLTSFLVFSSVGLLFGPWKSFLSGKQLKTHSMLSLHTPLRGSPHGDFLPIRFLLTLSAPSSLPSLDRVSALKALGTAPDGLP